MNKKDKKLHFFLAVFTVLLNFGNFKTAFRTRTYYFNFTYSSYGKLQLLFLIRVLTNDKKKKKKTDRYHVYSEIEFKLT